MDDLLIFASFVSCVYIFSLNGRLAGRGIYLTYYGIIGMVALGKEVIYLLTNDMYVTQYIFNE